MSSRFRSAWGHPSVCGFLAIIAATTLLACSGGTEPTATPLAPAVGLSISPTGLSLIVGDEARLTARAFNSMGGTASASFEWSSADPTIATVRRLDGTVTAIAAGTTTVTATAGTLSATATVAVRPPDPPVGVSLSMSGLSLIAGSVERLTARAFDSTGRTTSVSFEWSSANLAVATVDKTDGTVTAISAGATTMTATAGTLRATATVSVIALAGSFSFSRWSESNDGSWTPDVLSFSVADGTTRSLPLPRSGQLGSIGSFARSPDGTLLVFEGIHATFDRPSEHAYDYNSDIYVVDAAAPATSPWRALTANGLSKAPSWSPDGKRIAYLQQEALFANSHIYVINAAGGQPVRVTRTDGSYSGPRWSPDGTRLTFTDWSVGDGDVFIVNADGSGLTNVSLSPGIDYEPSWSPDGARLVFASSRESSRGDFRVDVFVVDVNGSNVRRLASLSEYSSEPAWSADGRQIMFSSGGALYVMTADGSSLGRLTTPPPNSVDRSPVWSR